jgi:hypothetical protein
LEVSGKEILIGVYNYVMIFAQFPGALGQLIIRISIDLLDITAKQFSVYLRDPKGTNLHHFTAPFNQLNPKEPIVLGFAMQGLTIYSAGIYTIFLGVDDEEPEKISDFEARNPQDEVERKRIPQQALNA